MYGKEPYLLLESNVREGTVYYRKEMYGKEPYLLLERNVQEGTVFTTGK